MNRKKRGNLVMKKYLVLVCVIIIGAFIEATIDHLTGINLKGVSSTPLLLHDVARGCYGAAIFAVIGSKKLS